MMTDDDVKRVAAEVSAALAAGGMPPGGSTAPAAGAEGDGKRPQVRLPGEGRLISSFAAEVGQIMAKDGVYLRDGTPVVVDPVRGRIVDLDADCFRSYVEQSLVTVKMRQEKGEEEARPVAVTMSRDTAKAVLTCHEFRRIQRPVRQVWPVPVPVRGEDGKVRLAGPGYVPEAQILITGEGRK
jgi:hypothetical protein